MTQVNKDSDSADVNSIGASLQFRGLSIRAPRFIQTERPVAEDSFSRIQPAFDALSAGRWSEALELLTRLVVYFPEHARLLLYKGLAQANLSQFGPAVESLKWFLQKEPTNQEGIKMLEQVQALHQAQAVTQVASQASLFDQALACLERNNELDAIEKLDQLMQSGARDPGLNYFRALALFKLDRFQEAANAVQAQLGLSPMDKLTLALQVEIDLKLKAEPNPTPSSSANGASLRSTTELISFKLS